MAPPRSCAPSSRRREGRGRWRSRRSSRRRAARCSAATSSAERSGGLHLEGRVERRARCVGEGEVMGCDLGRDRQPSALRVADQRRAPPRSRDGGRAAACRSARTRSAVARDDRRSRRPRAGPGCRGGSTTPPRACARRRRGSGPRSAGRRPPRERGRVLERAAHHPGRLDAGAVVGEEAHAERVQLADRRQLARRRGPGDAARRRARHRARLRARGEHRGDDGRVVEGRLGVRHRDDAR